MRRGVPVPATFQLDDLRLFVKVCALRNLTAAAEQQGLPKSAVSRALSRLEQQLGAKLLERTSRRVSVTEAGRLLLGGAEALLAQADALGTAVRDEGTLVRGTVRMAASPEVGAAFIEGVLPRLRAAHPELVVAMKLSYEQEDLLDPAIDLALRAGRIGDDRLVALPVGRFSRILVAQPAFAAAHAWTSPQVLATLPVLGFGTTHDAQEWSLEAEGQRAETVVVTPALAVDSFSALLHAAAAGLGVARVPEFAARRWIARGELCRVLAPWASPAPTVWLMHRFGHARLSRIAAVIEAARATAWL
jgi:DNA-binding transcriptional LysR family regulator